MIRSIDYATYVPVVRWKGAERTGLLGLSRDVRRRIVPLIELVPNDFLPLAEAGAIQKFAKQIAETWGWGPSAPVLLDTHLLGGGLATSAIGQVIDACVAYGVKGAIVTGISRNAAEYEAVREACARSGFDICVRVSAFEFRQSGFASTLEDTIDRLHCSPSQASLIVDFQAIPPNGINLRPWLDMTPRLTEWHSLIFLSGAFPKDLAALEPNEQHVLPRGDWEGWLDLVAMTPIRIPAFGDYTIQYGLFEEREGKHFNFSASIRYTTPDGWIVMRGEGVLNEDGPGYAQWPANALLLCERTEFEGAEYSWGDKYIADMGRQIVKTGSAKEWLAAGINHHVTLVAKQLLDVRVRAVSASAIRTQFGNA
jgi:hypothetical protein